MGANKNSKNPNAEPSLAALERMRSLVPRVGVEWDEESTADERKKLTRAVDSAQLLADVGERRAAPPPGFFPQHKPAARKAEPKTPVVVPAARRQGQRALRGAARIAVPSFVDDESTADGQTRVLRPDVEVIVDEASLTGEELAAIEADKP